MNISEAWLAYILRYGSLNDNAMVLLRTTVIPSSQNDSKQN